MAYQVISQNNTTTTLADENGNVIHVPARVNLATSTDYTITKVNNNTATLEDGNGNIIRDVPCVAVLYGEGGGEPVDYSKTVQKTTTMPTADSSNAGDVYMYTGATDANYTTNYIYENIATTTSSSATASQTTGSSLSDVAVVLATFETQIITSGSYAFTYDGADWSLNSETVDLTDYGITYTGTPVADDVITVVYTESSTTYAWTRIDVQPAPEALPDQTGNSGKFLTTDGTSPSWSDKPLVNTATGTNALGVLGTAQAQESIALGAGSITYSLNAGRGAISIGFNAKSNNVGNISIGSNANSGNGKGSIAIGQYAEVVNQKRGAIQLGWGSNNNSGTMCVALSTTGDTAGSYTNYELLSSDGTIPTARLTKVNSTITLAVADWNGGTTVTKTVAGMTATGVVLVSPDPTDQSAYTSAGILCTAQAAGTLTFTCDTVPSADIDVNVVML